MDSQHSGDYVAFAGTRITGRGDGTRLGFPTINLQIQENIKSSLHGVWCSFLLFQDEHIPSVTHIGSVPLYGMEQVQVEVHVLDWDDAYLQNTYQLVLVHKLRDTIPFIDEKKLIAQIRKDVKAAREFFDSNT